MDDIRLCAVGHVEASVVGPDGSCEVVESHGNMLMYRCADAAARLFSGDFSARPSVIGFVHASGSSQAANFHFTGVTADKAKKQTDIVGSNLSVEDAQLNPGGKLEGTNANYAGNRVVLSASTSGMNSVAHYVYGVLLKDGTGPSANVLAVRKFTTPVLKAAGSSMYVTWGITFT